MNSANNEKDMFDKVTDVLAIIVLIAFVGLLIWAFLQAIATQITIFRIYTKAATAPAALTAAVPARAVQAVLTVKTIVPAVPEALTVKASALTSHRSRKRLRVINRQIRISLRQKQQKRTTRTTQKIIIMRKIFITTTTTTFLTIMMPKIIITNTTINYV